MWCGAVGVGVALGCRSLFTQVAKSGLMAHMSSVVLVLNSPPKAARGWGWGWGWEGPGAGL